MLPCNVIVCEVKPGTVEVVAVDPVASMMTIGNPSLGAGAGDVRDLLADVMRAL